MKYDMFYFQCVVALFIGGTFVKKIQLFLEILNKALSLNYKTSGKSKQNFTHLKSGLSIRAIC